VYELLLRKETFFNWNRAYLLITSVVSLVVPFIKLKSFATVIPSEFIISLPTVILGETKPVDSIVVDSIETALVNNQSLFSVVWIWYAGIVVFTVVLLFKLFRIWRFKLTSSSVQRQGYSIITLKNSEDAFSFLKSIFLGDQIESTQKESILKHEKVHVEERHTIDLLWFEILRIVFWFNPLVYIYQKRITEVHEFIADKSASKYQQNYYENLLAKTFNIAQFSLVNQFYSSSLIKKRIIMLTKEKSNKTKLVKYVTIIPIVLSMLVYVSCTDALEVENSTEMTVSSETTVLEDVHNIIIEKLPNPQSYSKPLTATHKKSLRDAMKEYIKENDQKINNTDWEKYREFYVAMIYGKPEEEKQKVKTTDLYVFFTSSTLVKFLIDDVKRDTELTNPGILNYSRDEFNQLASLNYILPNEQEYQKKYDEFLKSDGYDKFKKDKMEEENSINISNIDTPPIYPGCNENATTEDLQKCFSMSIAKHVNEHFDTNIAKNNNLSGRQRINTMFKIDNNGMIMDIKVRAPHQSLVTETERVLNLLPKMKPGIHEGKVVTVPYSLPIIIQVN